MRSKPKTKRKRSPSTVPKTPKNRPMSSETRIKETLRLYPTLSQQYDWSHEGNKNDIYCEIPALSVVKRRSFWKRK